jgi:hypothetical protein
MSTKEPTSLVFYRRTTYIIARLPYVFANKQAQTHDAACGAALAAGVALRGGFDADDDRFKPCPQFGLPGPRLSV